MLKRLRRHYYAQITHIDYQLGRLFGELKSKGLYNNTVIVMTSDHGEHLGDHRQFAKYTFLESAAHVPIILRLPTDAGICNAHEIKPVLTADIVPTLLQLAGLSPDPQMDGISLLHQPDDRTLYGETTQSVFAANSDFKYIYYFDHGIEQLFDVNADANDCHNLAAQPELADVLDSLKAGLIRYLQANQRPAVAGDELLVIESELDIDKLRAQNTAAWRGPLRYGQGYG